MDNNLQLEWVYLSFKIDTRGTDDAELADNDFVGKNRYLYYSCVCMDTLYYLLVFSYLSCTIPYPLHKHESKIPSNELVAGYKNNLFLFSVIIYLPSMRNARKGPLCNKRTPQAQICLRISVGWSGHLLSAQRINRYCSICRQTEKTHIRLHGCAGWSGPSLFACDIRVIFPCCHYERMPI